MTKKVPAFIEKDETGIKKIILVNPEDQFKHRNITIINKEMPKKRRVQFVKPLMPILKDMFKNNEEFRQELIGTIPDPRVVTKDAVEMTK